MVICNLISFRIFLLGNRLLYGLEFDERRFNILIDIRFLNDCFSIFIIHLQEVTWTNLGLLMNIRIRYCRGSWPEPGTRVSIRFLHLCCLISLYTLALPSSVVRCVHIIKGSHHIHFNLLRTVS